VDREQYLIVGIITLGQHPEELYSGLEVKWNGKDKAMNNLYFVFDGMNSSQSIPKPAKFSP